jgi:hypothetical protein
VSVRYSGHKLEATKTCEAISWRNNDNGVVYVAL